MRVFVKDIENLLSWKNYSWNWGSDCVDEVPRPLSLCINLAASVVYLLSILTVPLCFGLGLGSDTDSTFWTGRSASIYGGII